MVESIYFLKPAWCGETFCRPSAGTGLTARYKSHRLEAVVCHYVMAGEGTVSVFTRGQPEAAAIRTGDAVPIQLSEVHSIENTGTQPLELMAVGVARDTHKELDYVDASAG